MATALNRRKHMRFTVQPMYTPVSVKVIGDAPCSAEGHAYDVSEGGVRFEVDQLIEPGTEIAMQITLPALQHEDLGAERSILVFGEVVWVEDTEDPPPVRTAMVFTHFAKADDRERLLRHFASGFYRMAA